MRAATLGSTDRVGPFIRARILTRCAGATPSPDRDAVAPDASTTIFGPRTLPAAGSRTAPTTMPVLTERIFWNQERMFCICASEVLNGQPRPGEQAESRDGCLLEERL